MVSSTFLRFRSSLPAPSRAVLDKLAVKLISAPTIPVHGNLIDRCVSLLQEVAPALSAGERQALAFYTLAAAASGVLGAPATGGDTTGALMNATQQMQMAQMSFNLQYLQLQNEMQNENRQYTTVSNVMKTKHDTVKNTISNIH
jgi:hypothetical protein